MSTDEKLTLQIIGVQLRAAQVDLESGDILRARERLAVIVAGLDRICYGDYA